MDRILHLVKEHNYGILTKSKSCSAEIGDDKQTQKDFVMKHFLIGCANVVEWTVMIQLIDTLTEFKGPLSYLVYHR